MYLKSFLSHLLMVMELFVSSSMPNTSPVRILYWNTTEENLDAGKELSDEGSSAAENA